MIKIENVEVVGWEAGIRGMRNPKNSWDKSDSFCVKPCSKCSDRDRCEDFYGEINGKPYRNGNYLGSNDKKLAMILRNAGKDHRKYLRYFDVYLDITAPLYFWKEFKTYRKNRKFLDDEDFYDYDDSEIEEFIEMNSCSTMHKIHAKEFTLNDFSCEHLSVDSKVTLGIVVSELNHNRDDFLETKDKKYWWQMIQLLPSSYNQKRTVKLNYEVLLRMYKSRKNHKLDEWVEFCKWIETLPYAKELIIGD